MTDFQLLLSALATGLTLGGLGAIVTYILPNRGR